MVLLSGRKAGVQFAQVETNGGSLPIFRAFGYGLGAVWRVLSDQFIRVAKADSHA